MSRIPPVMRAVILQKRGAVEVKQIPVPTLDACEILVKVMNVALNPTDWKHIYHFPKPDTIIGCDFSGVVVKLGASVKGPVQVGDHVAGFVQGCYWADRGAFAEYLKTDWDLVWPIPTTIFSHQEAASMSTCLWTAVQAMYHPGRLAIPEPPAKVDPDQWFFIYGGSTSVGQYAIQLARISGFKVATVASPHHHARLRELGAEVVFDYKQSDVVEEIKKATNDAIHYALDAHAADGSQLFTVRTLGPGPGTVVVILAIQDDAKNFRADVKVIFTLLYTVLGREFSMGNGKTFVKSEEDRAHMSAFLPKLTQLITEGKIQPTKIKPWGGGLEAIWDGMEYMRAGKVSGEKIVYQVADEEENSPES